MEGGKTLSIFWFLGCQSIKLRPTELFFKGRGEKKAELVYSPPREHMPLREYAEYFVRGGRKDGEQGGRGPQRRTTHGGPTSKDGKLLTEQGGISPQACM